MTGNNKVWRAPLAGLAAVAMLATMGVAASTANAATTAEYKVTFNTNGRGGSNSEQKVSEASAVDFTKVTKPSDSTNQWVFTGWYTSAKLGEGSKFNPDTKVVSDTTLYAHWAKKADVKTVTFVNGANVAKYADTDQDGFSYAKDGKVDVDDQTVKLAPGDKLASWEKPSDKSDSDYKVISGFTSNGKDFDFSAAPTAKTTNVQINAADAQKVTFKYHNTLGNSKVVEVAKGTAVTAPTTADRDKIVDRWQITKLDASAVQDPNSLGAGVIPTTDPETNPDNTKTYYWYSGSTVPTYKTAVNSPESVAKDVELTASPSEGAVKAYRVNFDVKYNRGAWIDSVDPVFVGEGSSIDLPTVNLYDGLFELDGWYKDAGYTAAYGDEAVEDANDGRNPVILYAKVKRVNVEHTVTFDPNYTGSDTSTVTVKDGEAVTAPADPTRDGYVFAGWYTKSNDWTSLYDATAPVTETSPKTLYAKWTKTADAALEKLITFGHKSSQRQAYTAASWKAYVKTASELADKYGVKNVYDTTFNTVSAGWLNDSDGYKFTDAHVLVAAANYKTFKVSVENLSDAQVEAYTKALTEAQGKLTANDQQFTDVFEDANGQYGTPHYDEIFFDAKEGIVQGYGDGTFKPTGSMFRQDYAAFLYRLAGSPEYTVSAADNKFTDVNESTPHYKEILWAAKQGIIKGFADGTFRGTALVNRQDAAAFLYRLAGSPEFDESKAAKQFSDVTPGNDSQHAKEVLWAANTVVNADYDQDGSAEDSTAIVNGFPSGTFDGTATLLRQDGAAFIARTYFYINK